MTHLQTLLPRELPSLTTCAHAVGRCRACHPSPDLAHAFDTRQATPYQPIPVHALPCHRPSWQARQNKTILPQNPLTLVTLNPYPPIAAYHSELWQSRNTPQLLGLCLSIFQPSLASWTAATLRCSSRCLLKPITGDASVHPTTVPQQANTHTATPKHP